MLERLQRWLLLAGAVSSAASLALGAHLGRPWLGAAGAALIVFGYTAVLALEFLLMALAHRDDPTPQAGFGTLVRAWGTECRVALRVFGWQQPFHAKRFADVPGRPGERGVVFVHGYLCNRGIWNPWLRRCAEGGHPCVAVSLEPVFGPLDAYAPQIEQAVARLERETGLAPVIVAHSMGGLVVRAWLASEPGADARVDHVFTIGTPHRGTWLARLSRTANSLQMRQSCEWLRALEAREPPERATRFTSFYGHADNIVFPPLCGLLAGSRGAHLVDTPHVAMAFHPAVEAAVFARLAREP